MYKTYIKDENGVVTPFTYKRPRPFIKALSHYAWRVTRRFIRFVRRNSRRIAHIITKSVISGFFVALGIVAGLTIVGLLCFFCGICFAACQECESNEEYNAQVIAHFQARGQAVPRRALKGVTK